MSEGQTGHGALVAWGEVPDFAAIRVEDAVSAVAETLGGAEAALEALEGALGEDGSGLGIEEVVGRLERLEDRVGWTWGLLNHLNAVRTNEALRAVVAEAQPAVVTFLTRLGQSRPIFRAFEAAVVDAAEDPALARTVALGLRGMRHAGIGLEGGAQARFNAITQELAEREFVYGNQLLDATKAFHRDLGEAGDVLGLPASTRALLAGNARAGGIEAANAETGPWRLTLDAPSVTGFLEHAERRDLRELVYRQYIGRAGPEAAQTLGTADNSALATEILALRDEQAKLLGFASFAALSLDAKMAETPSRALELITRLGAVARPRAIEEHAALERFAREISGEEALELAPWDVAYWARRQREALFTYSEEELKPYFPLPKVLEGLFTLVKRLFGVSIREGDRAGWHPDVRWFDVFDDIAQAPIAGFFLDPYSRPADKRGGAWMNELRGRSRLLATGNDEFRTPIAYLVCNQTPPLDGRPSLMTWHEVSTLFHELGHGLQHMLTRVDRAQVAGISGVEWDAVELPSQFMELWLRHPATVRSFARHVDTGAPIPEALVARVLAASTFRAGSATLRQLYFARLDLALHAGPLAAGDTIWDVMHRIAADYTVLRPLPEDRFLCGFGHLFGGGYAAGYYSYKWAEVLASDAFAAFEEAGLDDDRAVAEVGRRYRETILGLGGSVAPMEVFRRFRGREPSPEALLRHHGLVEG